MEQHEGQELISKPARKPCLYNRLQEFQGHGSFRQGNPSARIPAGGWKSTVQSRGRKSRVESREPKVQSRGVEGRGVSKQVPGCRSSLLSRSALEFLARRLLDSTLCFHIHSRFVPSFFVARKVEESRVECRGVNKHAPGCWLILLWHSGLDFLTPCLRHS